jgi:hypothetical protein
MIDFTIFKSSFLISQATDLSHILIRTAVGQMDLREQVSYLV